MMLHRHFEKDGKNENMTTLADVTPVEKEKEPDAAPKRKGRPKKSAE